MWRSRDAQLNVAWSLWMASLTFLPAQAIMGEECIMGWRRMLCKRRPDNLAEADLLFSTLGLLVGNWLACVVIPLDWGRAWQAWPVPNVLVGSVAFLMGSLLAHVLFRGARLVPIVEVRSGSSKAASRSPTKAVAATPRKSAAARAGRSKSPRRAASPKRSPSPKRSGATPRTARKLEVEVPRTPRQGRARSVSRTPRKVSSPTASRSSSKSPRRSTRHA